MPDLSQQAVHQFWYDFQDPIIYKVISFMEGVEDWCIDGEPRFEQSLVELGNALEDIGNIDLKLENKVIDLIARVTTGRGLRILMCLDMAYPGAAAKILMHAEETQKSEQDPAGNFLRRNIVFERLRLLSRTFSAERFKLITKALESGIYD